MRPRARVFGGEVSGHYYFRRLLLRRLGHAARAADPGAAVDRAARRCRSCWSPTASRYFISGEINTEVADPAGQARGDRRALLPTPARAGWTGSRSTTTTGTSTCARPTPSRCCACAWSRWSPREHMEAKRDEVLGADPLVSAAGPRAPLTDASPGRRGRAPASTASAVPTPFLVGRVNCYLIEDEPLTLVDTGPNSGKSLDELERALRGARPPDRGSRADRHHPPAHGPPRAAGDPRPPLGGRGRRAGTCSAPTWRTSAPAPPPTTVRDDA